MSWWEAVLDLVGILAVLGVLSIAALVARRRWLSRSGGTFECSVRMNAPSSGARLAAGGRGWTLGLGRYSGDMLEWFRIFSFSLRPKYVFDRSLRVGEQRTPEGAEAFSLQSGHLVVAVDLHDRRSVEFAMSSSALTGLLAWVEAAPPGDRRLG
jgi:hypothetical protein